LWLPSGRWKSDQQRCMGHAGRVIGWWSLLPNIVSREWSTRHCGSGSATTDHRRILFTSGNAAKAYPQSSPSLLTSSCPARDASCMCPAAPARPAFSPFCSLCEPFLSHQPVCTLKNLVRKNAWPMGLPEQGTLLPRFFLHSSTSTCSPPGLRHPN